MARPRKYHQPEFEEFLLKSGRTGRRMARIYVQQVSKLAAYLTADPSQDEVLAAVTAVGAHEHHTRAAWHAYVDWVLQAKGQRLPTLYGHQRTPRLLDFQVGLAKAVAQFILETDASLRECASLRVSDLQLYRADPDRLGVEVQFREPSRRFYLLKSRSGAPRSIFDPVGDQLDSAWDAAYSLHQRDVPVFPVLGPSYAKATWNEWCNFAAAAGLKARLPTAAPVRESLRCLDMPRATSRDSAFGAWLLDPSQSWTTLEQAIYGGAAEDDALVAQARANVDKLVDGR